MTANGIVSHRVDCCWLQVPGDHVAPEESLQQVPHQGHHYIINIVQYSTVQYITGHHPHHLGRGHAPRRALSSGLQSRGQYSDVQYSTDWMAFCFASENYFQLDIVTYCGLSQV